MSTDTDSDPRDFGMPPLAPLTPDESDDTPPPPPAPRRRRRGSVPAHDSILDQTEEDERIARLLEDDDNAGATVEIGRKTPNNKWAFCCSFPVAEWSSESKVQIANEFGGGSYRAVIKRSDKTIASNFTFEIDANVKPKQLPAAPQFNVQELVAQLRPQQGDNSMVQMMQAQQAMMMQFMQMQAQQSAENMKALVSIMARPVAATPASNDKFMEILLTKALDPKPAMDLPKVIEAVAKLRTVANGGEVEEDDGEEKGDDIFGSVVKALPGLIGLIGQGARASQVAQNPRPSARPRPRPQPTPAPVAPSTPVPAVKPETATEDDPIEVEIDGQPAEVTIDRGVLALFLPQVVDLAKQNVAPEQAVVSIREALPGGQDEVLAALLRRDDWLDMLIDAHRPVMVWTKWFSALREIFIAPPEPVPQETPVPNP
jgi:hypothetical protein